MKADPSKRYIRAAMLLLFTLLSAQVIFSQTTDTTSSTSCGAVQFQLVGGLGVYYLGDCGQAGHYRIGGDLRYSHRDQSGDGVGYSTNGSTPPPSSSGSSNVGEPDQNVTSYEVSFSGLYLCDLVQYKHAIMYSGLGPMASYAWLTSSYKDKYIQSGGSSSQSENGDIDKTIGIGPLAIIGVKSRVLGHVELSAEIAVSAVYQWTTSSSSYSYTSIDAGSPPHSYNNQSSDVSHLTGWTVAVSTIRLGLILEL